MYTLIVLGFLGALLYYCAMVSRSVAVLMCLKVVVGSDPPAI